MIKNIHHINFVVHDINKAIHYFDHLLSQQAVTESLHQRKVKTALYTLGDTYLVIVQPTSTEGVVAEILANKGEGIFLLSFETQSIEDLLSSLEIQYSQKRQGINDWSICDISPYEKFGAILQLTQVSK